MSGRKVVVFGATGNTGLCAIREAIKMGYKVTAFVRTPSKLPDDIASELTVVSGDVLDMQAVERSVEGQDSVVILLGRRDDLSETTVMSDGTKNIIEAMKKFGVKRVSACMSAFNFRERSQVPDRFAHILTEHERMLEALKASDLEWIAVLPPHIADSEGKGDYVTQDGAGPGRTISKYDLAHFMIACLTEDSRIHKLWGICDKP